MDRGQLLLLAGFLLTMIIAWRLPVESLEQLIKEVLNRFEQTYIAGWALWFATGLGWFFHSRWQRQIDQGEIDRLATERTKLQQQLTEASLIETSRDGKQGKKKK